MVEGVTTVQVVLNTEYQLNYFWSTVMYSVAETGTWDWPRLSFMRYPWQPAPPHQAANPMSRPEDGGEQAGAWSFQLGSDWACPRCVELSSSPGQEEGW